MTEWIDHGRETRKGGANSSPFPTFEPMKPPQEIATLIQDLARMYVGKPDQLAVKFQESGDGSSVYFMMRGSQEDDSRLIGRDGSHVDALTYLIQKIGEAEERIYTFRLLTAPERSDPWFPPKDADEYDPTPAKDMLLRILNALKAADVITVTVGPGAGPRTSLSFNFDVKIPDRKAAEALTASTGGVSTVGAIGTLFRAIAKQAGVRFQIRLADRAEK